LGGGGGPCQPAGPKYRIQNTKYKCQMPDARIQNPESRIQNTEYRIIIVIIILSPRASLRPALALASALRGKIHSAAPQAPRRGIGRFAAPKAVKNNDNVFWILDSGFCILYEGEGASWRVETQTLPPGSVRPKRAHWINGSANSASHQPCIAQNGITASHARSKLNHSTTQSE